MLAQTIALLAGMADEGSPTRCPRRRNGFAFAGAVEDPEDGLVWRWERRA